MKYSKHFFWFRVQALISLWVLLIYYLTLLLVKWKISHTADSTPHLIRDYVLTLWLNETPLNNNNNNNNNHHYHHFRGEIKARRFPFTAVTILMTGVVCLLSDRIALSSYALYHFPLDVAFQTEMQYEIIQSGATESVYYPKLHPEKLQREWLHSKRDLHLCKKQKGTLLDVLIQRSMHL